MMPKLIDEIMKQAKKGIYQNTRDRKAFFFKSYLIFKESQQATSGSLRFDSRKEIDVEFEQALSR